VFGEVLLTYNQPIKLNGIPPILGNGNDLPLTATQTADNEVYLTWTSQPDPGFVLEIPPWSPTIRGLNGEWAVGGPVVIGGGGGGTLPQLAGIKSATKTSANVIRFVFTAPWAVDSIGGILNNGLLAQAAVNVNATTVDYSYAATVNIGDTWSSGSSLPGGEAWQNGMYSSAENRWIAPASGKVV
jgi:hypothetical protein